MGGAFSLSSWFVPAPSASSLRTTSHLCSGSSTALQAKYEELASQLPQRGFEEAALAQARESFALGADGAWRPRMYDEAPWALPPNAVRVLALSISDAQLNGAITHPNPNPDPNLQPNPDPNLHPNPNPNANQVRLARSATSRSRPLRTWCGSCHRVRVIGLGLARASSSSHPVAP